jgi:hypothetical protein
MNGKLKWEMDKETQKDNRQTVQKKDNALSGNQPKGTKNGRPKEANFVKKQVSQYNFQRTEINKKCSRRTQQSHHLSPSSTFIGHARPMTPTTKKGCQLIGSLWAISLTNVARMMSAACMLPCWKW